MRRQAGRRAEHLPALSRRRPGIACTHSGLHFLPMQVGKAAAASSGLCSSVEAAAACPICMHASTAGLALLLSWHAPLHRVAARAASPASRSDCRQGGSPACPFRCCPFGRVPPLCWSSTCCACWAATPRQQQPTPTAALPSWRRRRQRPRSWAGAAALQGGRWTAPARRCTARCPRWRPACARCWRRGLAVRRCRLGRVNWHLPWPACMWEVRWGVTVPQPSSAGWACCKSGGRAWHACAPLPPLRADPPPLLPSTDCRTILLQCC